MYEGVGKNGSYEVFSNRESGAGRPDVMVIDKKADKAIILELKHVKNSNFKTEEEKHKCISEALKSAESQIKVRNYGSDFHGEIEFIPVVACGKAFYFDE